MFLSKLLWGTLRIWKTWFNTGSHMMTYANCFLRHFYDSPGDKHPSEILWDYLSYNVSSCVKVDIVSLNASSNSASKLEFSDPDAIVFVNLFIYIQKKIIFCRLSCDTHSYKRYSNLDQNNVMSFRFTQDLVYYVLIIISMFVEIQTVVYRWSVWEDKCFRTRNW